MWWCNHPICPLCMLNVVVYTRPCIWRINYKSRHLWKYYLFKYYRISPVYGNVVQQKRAGSKVQTQIKEHFFIAVDTRISLKYYQKRMFAHSYGNIARWIGATALLCPAPNIYLLRPLFAHVILLFWALRAHPSSICSSVSILVIIVIILKLA